MNRKLVTQIIAEILGPFLLFLAIFIGVRLLFVSFLTYLFISPGTHLGDLSDTLSTHELTIAALSSLTFVMAAVLFYPLTNTPREKVFRWSWIQMQYFRANAKGAILALGFCLALILIGAYRYLGFFIHFENTSMAFLGLIIRAACWVVMVYCEEYFFREHLFTRLLRIEKIPPALPVIITSFLFVGLKAIQFDLGWMHAFTLLLVALRLGWMRLETGGFVEGAGFWTGMGIIIHVIFGLSILGVEFPGVLLLKYIEPQQIDRYDIFLTGGPGGPLSSFLFQFYLSITILWQAATKKFMIRA